MDGAPEFHEEMELLLAEADELSFQGEHEKALDLYRQALQQAPDALEALWGMGCTLEVIGTYEAARAWYERCVARPAADPSDALLQADVLARLGRFEDAMGKLEQLGDDDEVDALFLCDLLGRLHAMLGDVEGAGHWFGQACELDPTLKPPVFLARGEFEGFVKEALARLPPKLKARSQEVTVLVEDRAPSEWSRREDHPLSPFILGCYEEPPHGLPGKVFLFQRPLELECTARGALRELVYTTLLHELGHAFGLSEGELTDLGLE